MPPNDLRPLHRRALEEARGHVERITVDLLTRPTPCAGWDLAALLAHIVGQHDGFAVAVTDGDAPPESYGWRPVGTDRIAADWQDSADRLTAAFAAAPLDRPVRLVEISPTLRFPAGTAIGFQLLDTVIPPGTSRPRWGCRTSRRRSWWRRRWRWPVRCRPATTGSFRAPRSPRC